MTDIVLNNDTGDRRYGDKFFLPIIQAAVRKLKLSDKFSLSVNLVGKTRIKSLNKKYRRKDKPTDVLSFPLENEAVSKLKRKGAIIDLGDIFICFEVAKKSAAGEGVGLDKKLASLTIHGLLHLLGYGHEAAKGNKGEMFSLQNKILNKWQNNI